MNKKILILVIVLFFISLSAVSAQDNETVLSEDNPIPLTPDDLAVNNDTAISISTSVSNSKIYIGNQTEITVTVKNVGNCDVENLTILNLQTLGNYFGKDLLYIHFWGYTKSETVDTLHYGNLESINDSWIYTEDGHDFYSRFRGTDFNLFVLNGTLKVNQSSSFKIIYNTTKANFYDHDNVYFFAYSNSSLLNYTHSTICPSQIPRTFYINRSIQNDSLIVNVRVSSLDNSVVSGELYIKILDKDILLDDAFQKVQFEGARVDFVNNTGNITLKLPLNNHPYYQVGIIIGVTIHEVYSYRYVFDSFDERLVTLPSIQLRNINPQGYVLATDLVKFYKSDYPFIAYSNKSSCDNITFKVNGVTYVRSIDEYGFAKLNINLAPGVYVIESSITPYCRVENTITVLPTLIGDNLVKYYRDDSQFMVKLVDSNNNPVASENVTFNINGVFYSRQTNDEGIARLNINLSPGEYIITATDPLTGFKRSYNITVLPTLIGDNLVKYYMNDSQFMVKLVDSNNNPVASENVTFNINGVFYSRQTNDEGIARLNINLSPGEYIITAIDPLTGLKRSYNITVLPVLYAENIVSNDSSCYYKVKLVDNRGYPLPGKSISFNIGGLIYNVITNPAGEAKLLLNLMPGKYIVTAQYLSAKISNDIVILKK